MLKSWSIKNFKPIVDSGELELAPVTVFAGKNSSGKSSLLQSILMIAQTLGSRLLDRPLLPNERLVQLGTFEDVLNEKFSSHNLDIHLEFGLDEETGSRVAASAVSINISFASNNGKSNRSNFPSSAIIIDNVQLSVLFNTYQLAFNFEEPDKPLKENVKVNFHARWLSPEEKQEFLENVREDFYDFLPDTNNYVGNFYYNQNNHPEDLYLIELAHFLPGQFIAKFNIMEQYKLELEQDVSELFQINYPHARVSDTSSTSELYISDELYEALSKYCQAMEIPEIFTGETFGDLANWYRSRPWTSESERIAFGQDLQELCMPYLLEIGYDGSFTNYTEGLRKFVPPPFFEKAIEQIRYFFTTFIRYLGPLRTDPGTIQQQFAPTGEPDYVGLKGEYAAIVYHANKDASIQWYNPQTKRTERAALQTALNIWAHYLNLADRIATEEAGAIGITWRIIPHKGCKPRSLPAVGVGISQILPILVMGLLSPANSLLIIEQPELHLHPYVQARLGDFFMGLAKCKKQCLIETHSENLVSQLRLHIVEAGGLEKSDCMVYFVDQDEKGAAQFKQIEISPNGNILNWPDGFFDETMLQEDRITAASLRKRAQEAKHGS